MRHPRIALVLTLASTASAGFLACSSAPPTNPEDTPDSGGSPMPDGGGTGDDATVTAHDGSASEAAAPDGSIPVTMAEAGPDASDAAADAIEEPAPPAPIQVLVINRAGPEMGATIVFSDPTGALLATAVTDGHGSVLQEVATGSQVTALLGTTAAPNLVTVTGVKPGDVLTLIDGPLDGNDTTVSVTFNAFDQGDASVNDYVLSSSGCGADTQGAAGTFEYGLGNGCANASGQFPVLVQAMAGAPSYDWMAWQSGKGTVATPDAGVASVDLGSTGWSTMFGTQSVTLLNAPDSLTPGVGFSEFTAVDSASSVAFGLSTFTGQFPDAGIQAFAFTSTHPGLADFDQVEADYQVSEAQGASQLAIADRVNATTLASPSASDTIDLNDALPAIISSTLDATDPLRPNLGWTSAAPLSTASATVVQVQWSDPVDDAGDTRTGNWTIIVPASQMAVVPPRVPAASGLGPTPMATWSTAFPMVFTMNGDAFPTYDAIRATAARVGPTLNVGASPLMIPALPSNGRARVTAYFPF
jgi:hypothetical protein